METSLASTAGDTRPVPIIASAGQVRILGGVVAVLLSAAACALSDEGIERDVAARLAAEPSTSALNVSVSVTRRIAFLSGITDTVEEQQQVLDLTRSVRGVQVVVNDIRLNEVAIADPIRRAFAADPLLVDVPIDVEVEAGVVRLSSDATDREQRERAVQLASAVAGVRAVEDRMR